jgi:hypothetical protein
MIKTFILLLSLVIGAMLGTGCNDEKDVIPVTYPVDVEVSDFILSGNACSWNWQTFRADTLYVINSVPALLELTSCLNGNVYFIDFENYTLLLSRGDTPQGVSMVSRYVQQTSINEYKLVIDVTMDMTTVPGSWKIAILCPKLSGSAVIDWEISAHH